MHMPKSEKGITEDPTFMMVAVTRARHRCVFVTISKTLMGRDWDLTNLVIKRGAGGHWNLNLRDKDTLGKDSTRPWEIAFKKLMTREIRV